MFSVWIDADSCPKKVREYIFNRTSKNSVPLYFVANREIPLNQKKGSSTEKFNMIVCKNEEQAADDYIFEHSTPGDIVITRDIPFAARLIEKKICVMNDRGLLFTRENIGEKLSERNFNLNLAILGLDGENKKTYYGNKEFERFCRCFDREFQQKLTNARYGVN